LAKVLPLRAASHSPPIRLRNSLRDMEETSEQRLGQRSVLSHPQRRIGFGLLDDVTTVLHRTLVPPAYAVF
jgi:hypothetical protein